MNSHLRVIAALFALMFLFGCGQSGPLFVPGDPSSVRTPPQQQQTTQEEEEDDENGPASP